MSPTPSGEIIVREPAMEDGGRLHELVRKLPPLAENSVYCNLLQCTHFSETCALAEQEGQLVGFVTGYLHPQKPMTYFLWQVGVQEHTRGRGLPKRMIQSILARSACRGVTTLEATVAPGNKASRALFSALAKAEGARCEVVPSYLKPEHFGSTNNTLDNLFRIHPLSTPPAPETP